MQVFATGKRLIFSNGILKYIHEIEISFTDLKNIYTYNCVTGRTKK